MLFRARLATGVAEELAGRLGGIATQLMNENHYKTLASTLTQANTARARQQQNVLEIESGALRRQM